MKRSIVILFSVFVCNFFAFGNSNAVITGTLGMRALPCFGEACPAVDVVNITNDTASFVLVKDGQYLGSFDELGGGYYFGDVVSIYGNTCEKQEYNGQYFYELSMTAILKDVSSEHFSAKCIGEVGDENQSTIPTITIENDSVIIQHIDYVQCCADFALRISEVINDTLYVAFSDVATALCDCMCNFAVRISVEKSVSKTMKVYYNGTFYDLNTSDSKQINNQYIQLSNPAEGIIEINGIEDYSNLNYEVCNSIGQTIQSGKLKQTIDLLNKKGVYILTIMQNQKIVVREKIIVK